MAMLGRRSTLPNLPRLQLHRRRLPGFAFDPAVLARIAARIVNEVKG
jgi:hypothetical protein